MAGEPENGLAIGELAERAGVPAPTLRSWETRYGFPRPRRLEGGHRRYEPGDVALIQEVLRQRAAGLSLEAAIGVATARGAEGESSVFAGLRRRQPDLLPQVVRKSTLLALTRAMEDEYCARAERAVLFASFQRQRFYRRSRDRWTELARTALVTTVFADFTEPPARRRRPARGAGAGRRAAAPRVDAGVRGPRLPGLPHRLGVPRPGRRRRRRPAVRGAVDAEPARGAGRGHDLRPAGRAVLARACGCSTGCRRIRRRRSRPTCSTPPGCSAG